MTGRIEHRRIPLRASIRTRMIAFATILIGGIVGFLVYYFPSRHIAALDEEGVSHVSMYGELFSIQVRSAVAFSDHETAREVLGSLSRDSDIEAVVLYGGDHAVLYSSGSASSWVTKASIGVRSQTVVRIGERVAVVAPVDSLEGPHGTLVIELSMRRALESERVIFRTAIGIGSAVVLIGVLLASLLARSLAQRLRAIGETASVIASGSTARVKVDLHDEIGVAALAFNQMLDELSAAESALASNNRELEARVLQRTTELVRTNDQLQDEMKHRATIEVELRHAQKLESVGRLAAGVAHEINTPMQFVSDNVGFARESAGAIATFLSHVQHTTDPVIAEQFEALDLAFVADQLPGALDSALDGLGRVGDIVRSMGVFAHSSRELARTDLNAAITSTLTIARNEYKYIADLQTDLGALPQVTCHAGEISQALLNILLNAAHAIASTQQPSRGVINVSSRVVGDDVEIAVSDTGGGIPEAVRHRVFDPFFTTKDVGKGTGQGLAIARAVVVDKHGGSIRFESELGQGTTFFMRIPVQPATLAEAA